MAPSQIENSPRPSENAPLNESIRLIGHGGESGQATHQLETLARDILEESREHEHVEASGKKVTGVCPFANRPGPCGGNIYVLGDKCCGWHMLTKQKTCK